VIGRDCRIGSRVTLTRGAVIGDGAEVLPGSVVSSEVPAGACVGGARARVVGRAGDADGCWSVLIAGSLVAQALALDAPPDLDRRLGDLPGWTPEAPARLVATAQHDWALDLSDDVALLPTQTVDELAALVHGRRHAARAATGDRP
jgi:hypothetical protein